MSEAVPPPGASIIRLLVLELTAAAVLLVLAVDLFRGIFYYYLVYLVETEIVVSI